MPQDLLRTQISSLPELVFGLSETLDLVHPALRDHQKRTAYIGLRLAQELGASPQRQYNVFLAGLLHDAGAVALRERLDFLEFEAEFDQPPVPPHAENGYRLLNTFTPMHEVARIVRYHHSPWDENRLREPDGLPLPQESAIIHLADRAAVLLVDETPLAQKIPIILARLREGAGTRFDPAAVQAFADMAFREHFWFEATDPDLPCVLAQAAPPTDNWTDSETLAGLARLICTLIDCRSRYTATHSSGVAASAHALARLAGFDEARALLMRIAGYLHDAGKLAIPDAILEKPGRLTPDEFFIVKAHSYFTHKILSHVPSLAEAEPWASQHHERPNGTGYPFRLKGPDLDSGARILAVADVFTALSEDRPYRVGLPGAASLHELWDMAKLGFLDPDLVGLLDGSFGDVEEERVDAQRAAVSHFQGLGLTMPAPEGRI